ncbi:hypothetical protein [Gemmatimonas sp.]|uniref:hypothetical protein n=1 Tax=Gemmatimonas sp. TaxID=1962908 RepID=UPI00356615D2
MTITTMGADFFPLTPEGGLLDLLLAIYGFAVFGYATAAIASFFVAREAEEGDGELAGAAQMVSLREEKAALNQRVETLLERLSERLRATARPSSPDEHRRQPHHNE